MYAGADKKRLKTYILHPPAVKIDWNQGCQNGLF